jgi:hypothetical protein
VLPFEALSLVAPPRISRKWVITKKPEEIANHWTKYDVQMGRGRPLTVGIYMCHLEDDPTQEAFMRIYCEIPITGTEDADLDRLVRQGVPASPVVCGELVSFKLLMKRGCSAVPWFHGYAEAIQDEHGLLPGGYISYIVWENVPRVPLTEEYFWILDLSARNDMIFAVNSAPLTSKSF